MEERAQYGPWQRERPRLVVIKDDGVRERFSALPHAVIRQTKVSRDARLLVAVLQMYGWQGGEITASHATLAADMGCGLKSLRVYLDELIEAGIITERDAGVRRQKVYTLTFNTSKTTHWEPSNTSETTDCPPSNAQVLPVQCVVLDDSNTSKTTHSKKKTPEKKTKEEELATTLLGAADAATPATTATKQKTSSSKKTACPQTFPLEAKHFEYGAGLGLSEARVRTETDKFLAHHRFKGTLGLDWHAGWQNWMRRAVQYDAPRGGSAGSSNHAAPASAAPAGTSSSKWDGWKGRHGMTVSRAAGYEDDR